jgi:glycosyltransferase involved in cell wall biosynthesis
MRLSFVVMAYNQESFIREAVAAAFAQDHDDLEIVLTDDCSTDATFAIMQEMAAAYTGPHTVILNRNAPNLGLLGHINKLFDLTTQNYIIYAAGDDISEPHRARRIAEAIERDHPHLIHSNVTDLDGDGTEFNRQRDRDRLKGLGEKSLKDLARAISHTIGATCVWHRDLFEKFGPITTQGLYEDQVLYFRARLLGAVTYIDERLVRYRRGIGLSFASKKDPMKQLDLNINVLRQRLLDLEKAPPQPKKIRKALTRKLDRRLAQREAALAGQPLPADDDEDDEGEI